MSREDFEARDRFPSSDDLLWLLGTAGGTDEGVALDTTRDGSNTDPSDLPLVTSLDCAPN